jgi:hypothetical protein
LGERGWHCRRVLHVPQQRQECICSPLHDFGISVVVNHCLSH